MQQEQKKVHTFANELINKRQLKNLIYNAFLNYGTVRSSVIVDRIKNLTFHYATNSALSLSVEDLRVPYKKRQLVGLTKNEVLMTNRKYDIGNITSVERFQKTIDIWNNANNFLKDEVLTYFRESDPLNPLYIMAFSGARGNISQVRQLVGMRGLMADPQGEIIDLPISSNFREGLNVTEYIISSYGARKGLVDTALRTADSGYLTRRLVDVAQDIIVREDDCQTEDGILESELFGKNLKDLSPLIGRILASPLFTNDGKLLANKNTEITPSFIEQVKGLEYKDLKIRSPFTCNSVRSVCRKCYGWHLAYSKIVDLGEAIGIVAAQSIGEPGTQLTMRTFHTGGVFSGELTKQLRSPFSGKVYYRENSKAFLFRTLHGEKGFRTSEEIKLFIKDSQNTQISLNIPTDSVLLVSNGQQVYANEIIAEIKKDANVILEEEQKDIYSDSSGECFFQNIESHTRLDRQNNILNLTKKAGLIWVLRGKLYSLPNFSNFHMKPGIELQENGTLSTSFVLNKYPGIVNLDFFSSEKKIYILNCSTSFQNVAVRYIKKQDTYILELRQTSTSLPSLKFQLEVQPNTRVKSGDTIGTLIDNEYKTKTGGIVTYTLDNVQHTKKKKDTKKIFSGYIYWIPEETHYSSDVSNFKVKNGKYISKGTEILPNIFSSIGGLVQIQASETKLTIKSGEILRFGKGKLKDVNRFIKPGEFIIPNQIIAQHLTYLEVVEIKGTSYLLARPVKTYSIARTKAPTLEHKFFPYAKKKHLYLRTVKRIFYRNWEHVVSSQGINLIQTSLILHTINFPSDLHVKLALNKFNSPLIDKPLKPSTQNQLHAQEYVSPLKFNLYEIIKLDDIIAKDISNDFDVNIKLVAKEGHYIRPNTILTSIEILIKRSGILAAIQSNYSIPNVFLFLENNDIRRIIFNRAEEDLKVSKGDLVRAGTNLTNCKRSPYSGQIYEIKESEILIRLGKPYLISENTILRVDNHSLIEQGDTIATLAYEKLKTTDIVQGLPKVEEILEARKIKNECLLSPSTGYYYLRSKQNIIEIINLDTTKMSIPVKSGTRVTFKNGDFIKVATPLTNGIISPHTKLDILFTYYCKIYNLFEACRLSFKGVQLFLLHEIQRTYTAQNVQISDKHIEIIVKQMTSKVCIQDSGNTTFLPGEILNFQTVEVISKIAEENGEIPPTYTPILLGITKAALNSDSFISAASFQETTKVLTDAAIEGKKDWLNGLKENVIIGRLIPAGTGFRYSENLEMLKREELQVNLSFQNDINKTKAGILNVRNKNLLQ